MKKTKRSFISSLTVTCLLLVTACTTPDEQSQSQTTTVGSPDSIADLGDPKDCIIVDMSVSSEKIELLTELARSFNEGDAAVDDKCVFARPQKKASGGAMKLLAEGWDETTEGPKPVVWSPAASTWGPILNARLSAQGKPEIVGDGKPFMLTPLVIAMPEPMAKAIGWPNESIGWADILELTNDDQGWARYGHPEWGEFKLGKTNPNFSTSGLSALLAQTYAATNKSSGLTKEDLAKEDVKAFGEGIEQSVVHYGDTTLTFLNNWYKADQRGAALSYVSAAAVEEKSVIDYNAGNPDGVLDPGEEARPPRIPLVAIYPEEGTVFSDNPFYILDAEWVDEDEKKAAQLFSDFVQTAENQEKVLAFGFRPGNPNVAISEPITKANGLDPDQPQTLLEIPDPSVMVSLLERWAEQRKGANVTILVDVSGSMGEPADGSNTRLDLAKQATISSLDQFKDDDLVGLATFTTNSQGTEDLITTLVEPAPVGQNKERIKNTVRGLFPQDGTPLYTATSQTYSSAVESYDPTRINAVVLLSDGVNDDGVSSDDQQQLDALLATLSAGSEGKITKPVRVFPIAYGDGADLAVLEQIADATTSAVYNSQDPQSIEKVFAEVISNF